MSIYQSGTAAPGDDFPRYDRGSAFKIIQSIATATSSERNIRAFSEIDALRTLEPGWDGYSGASPSEAAIEHAKAFVANLPADIMLPSIEPSGDGEINLVWRSPENYLEVGFTGDEVFSFFAKSLIEERTRVFGDVPTSAARLPLTLHAFLGRFTYGGMRLREPVSERQPIAWVS